MSAEGRARTTAPKNHDDGGQPSGYNSSLRRYKRVGVTPEPSPSGGWRATYYVMGVTPSW